LLHLGENLALIRVPVKAALCERCRTLAEFEDELPGARVLGVERPEGFLPTPSGDEPLRPGDSLVVYGAIDVLEHVPPRSGSEWPPLSAA
jgi:Trk K+ transport system NAD-binding subunit